jgi:exopolyphosphatase/guanosine-5'-triphosphate,3'-diphosphate pyrophosphatase
VEEPAASPTAPDRPIGAAIDVGSNSVHLLVARLGRRLTALRDESVLLGLGDVVDRTGHLPPAAEASLIDALAGYIGEARALGAQHVSLVATEPFRRAANGRAVAAAATQRLGLPLHILSERQEGELTFLGVSGGAAPVRQILVVDVGGGSSEVVLAAPGQPLHVISLPSGSGRLSLGIIEHDPPSAVELDALLAAAHRLIAGLPIQRPGRAVFVGGTATNLARLAPLRRDGLALAYRALAALPAAEVSARYGVNLRRARQLPAGTAIVDAILAHFGLDEAAVSKASLRDGAIIAADRLGEGWPGRLSGYLSAAHTAAWPSPVSPAPLPPVGG